VESEDTEAGTMSYPGAADDDIKVRLPDGKVARFPAGTPDADIEEALSTYGQPGADLLKPGVRIGETPAAMKLEDAPETLPFIGSVVGGKLGNVAGVPLGPGGVYGGGVIGAGLLGGAGEAGRLGIRKALGKEPDLTWDDFVTKVRNEALAQGTAEAVGGVAQKALAGTAKGLMRMAGRPSLALRHDFPNLIENALKHKAGFTEGAEEAATAAAVAGGERADAIIAAAQAAGRPKLSLAKDVIAPVVKELGPEAKIEARMGLPGSRETLVRRIRELRKANRARQPRPEPPPGPTPAEIRQAHFLGLKNPKPIGDPTGSLQVPEAIENIAEQQQQLGPQFGLAPASLFTPSTHEVQTALELGPQASLAPKRMIVGPEGPVPGLQVTREELGTLFNPTADAVPPPRVYRDLELDVGQEAKRKLQSLSTKAYKAEARGTPINSMEAAFNKQAAQALREGLERNVGEGFRSPAGKTLAEVNQETQELLGVANMIEASRLRPMGLLQTGLLSGLAGTGGAGAGYFALEGEPGKAAKAAGAGLLGAGLTSSIAQSLLARGAARTAPHAAILAKALLEAFKDRETPEE
jgi:hypothetical protein